MIENILKENNFIHWADQIDLDGKHKIGVVSDGAGNLTFGLQIEYPGVYQLNDIGYFNFFVESLGIPSRIYMLGLIDENNVRYDMKIIKREK